MIGHRITRFSFSHECRRTVRCISNNRLHWMIDLESLRLNNHLLAWYMVGASLTGLQRNHLIYN